MPHTAHNANKVVKSRPVRAPVAPPPPSFLPPDHAGYYGRGGSFLVFAVLAVCGLTLLAFWRSMM